LVFEEIQTCPPAFIDKVEQIFRQVMATIDPANAFKPWGGLIVVANGDILQSMQSRQDERWVGYETVNFLFQLPGFEEWFYAAVMLDNIYRSIASDGYNEFLHEICAAGSYTGLSALSIERLLSRVNQAPHPSARVLAWSRAEVNAGNEQEFNSAPGEKLQWTATITITAGAVVRCGLGNIDIAKRRLLDGFPEHLTNGDVVKFHSKQGLDVVLTANLDPSRGLHKDLHGILVGLEDIGQNKLPVVAFDNGVTEAVHLYRFKQAIAQLNGYTPVDPDYALVDIVPLCLGKWMTLTKSIGCEYSHVHLVLTSSQVWRPLSFIGMSRVRAFDSMTLARGF
jgi:hypothetical protein